ncbi:hypothetical protein [Clostridium estertheticum]|uniref:hypothetical protein n=1 Tax=Clostridium estertheticum TaxID=238834 RepID=UPI001C0BAE41|nr:hypothetical protein [Clostridium estertheticum]MBU3174049.1 hypothetical protein [Clostridium estertheticum]
MEVRVFLLTEGAIIERLKREFCIPLDKDILPAGLVYYEKGIEILSLIYQQYIDIADSYNIPIMNSISEGTSNRNPSKYIYSKS